MDQLTKLSKIARWEFENCNVNQKLLIRLYRKYNPQLKKADVFVKKGLSMFPNLCCGLASVYLQHLLGKGQIVRGQFQNHNHTFLLVDNKIVDITADQYGGVKVFIGSPEKTRTSNILVNSEALYRLSYRGI